MKIGLTMGKFLPFHKGHELLVRTACMNSDKTIILVSVSDDDPYSFQQRKEWIEDCLESFEIPVVLCTIIEQKEFDKNAEKDEEGTIIDTNYWKEWYKDTHRLISPIVKYWERDELLVFTSDQYGKYIAEVFDGVWYPVDPDRQIVPISATKIRENFVKNFKYLPQYVKMSLTKTVAIIGPESTGKSILAERLSEHFRCRYIPEYGKTLCQARKDLTKNDFEVIKNTQSTFLVNSLCNIDTVPLLVSDTEIVTTGMYASLYLEDKKYAESLKNTNQDFDLYLVLAPNVPFVQDGTRIQEDAMDRWRFFYELIAILTEQKKKFEIIWDSRFGFRQIHAEQYIDGLLSGSKT